jgi:hypothetical protein
VYKQVVRVATNNNFNCTDKEWAQLHEFSRKYPTSFFFVNSNVYTPHLEIIPYESYKAVVTVNPDLKIEKKWLDKALNLARSIAFIRIKWLPHADTIRLATTQLLMTGMNVVITLQRFNSFKSLEKYVGKTSVKDYIFECSRYRLHGPALAEIEEYVDVHARLGMGVYICDRKGLGCQECKLCSKLTTGGLDLPIKSLNLSTSGICPYHCPDCYAKTMQHFTTGCGNSAIAYDEIKANRKQAGHTAHIIKNKERK